MTEYAKVRQSAVYHVDASVWTLKEKGEIALPCAIQNEITEDLARNLSKKWDNDRSRRSKHAMYL